ncbi:MAG: 4-(cytidine 5'-diphospho)-2-C-methyl-D-erythritol kinase [Ginsengibacter sp.]
MVAFPHCKINLGLNILRKREDGYHDIETVFYPIPIFDIVEIITSEDKTHFTHSGIDTGEYENNLCFKAFHLVKNDFPNLPHVAIHLHKVIPIGAGLGGGSSDASFILSLLNDKYNLGISELKLFDYAIQLGSDCPFFLKHQTSFATGRGEILSPLNLDLSGYNIVIINPEIHINTKEIFQKIIPSIPAKRIDKIISQNIKTWRNELVNDFEKVVFPIHFELSEIKNRLYQQGAEYASMTGTGSTLFGIFKKDKKITTSFDDKYFVKTISL